MFWKKHKWKVIVPVLLIAALAFAFWYGGAAPGLQGWRVEKRPTATETPGSALSERPGGAEGTLTTEEKLDFLEQVEEGTLTPGLPHEKIRKIC